MNIVNLNEHVRHLFPIDIRAYCKEREQLNNQSIAKRTQRQNRNILKANRNENY